MDNIEILLICVIILSIIIRLFIKPSVKKVCFNKGSQIPYSKNPPPPPFRKSIYNTMSYSNSKKRIEAIKVLVDCQIALSQVGENNNTKLTDEIIKSELEKIKKDQEQE